MLYAHKWSEDKIEANSSKFEHVGNIQRVVQMHVFRLTWWNSMPNSLKTPKGPIVHRPCGLRKGESSVQIKAHNNKQMNQPTIYKLHPLLQNLAGKSKTWLIRGHGRQEKGNVVWVARDETELYWQLPPPGGHPVVRRNPMESAAPVSRLRPQRLFLRFFSLSFFTHFYYLIFFSYIIKCLDGRVKQIDLILQKLWNKSWEL